MNIELLNLEGCSQLTDECLKSIISNCKSLKYLDIRRYRAKFDLNETIYEQNANVIICQIDLRMMRGSQTVEEELFKSKYESRRRLIN